VPEARFGLAFRWEEPELQDANNAAVVEVKLKDGRPMEVGGCAGLCMCVCEDVCMLCMYVCVWRAEGGAGVGP
jgi:hypothetical protein